jgi:glycerol-3-phosphate dehydrogenase (NAD(P)+)
MKIAVIGAGAFGTALAHVWAHDGRDVTLWGRDPSKIEAMIAARSNPRLPGVTLSETLKIVSEIDVAFAAELIVLALPAQTLRGFLADHSDILRGKTLIAACKGIDLATMTGPVSTISQAMPQSQAAILTGPSFAADIARGLPTALTLASAAQIDHVQACLSTPSLRIYRSDDPIGAELGGALKNVMAIACGVAIGAGLGESARAALMTRGFAEMQRFAQHLGAQEATLAGLSGFGDLVLTCTSEQSRNMRFGLALGSETPFDPAITVEGAATAKAVTALAVQEKIDMPICTAIAALVGHTTTVAQVLDALLSRPLKEE